MPKLEQCPKCSKSTYTRHEVKHGITYFGSCPCGFVIKRDDSDLDTALAPHDHGGTGRGYRKNQYSGINDKEWKKQSKEALQRIVRSHK